jgi:hypothetical protein
VQPKTGHVFGFYCDDFRLRPQCFHGKRNTRNQTGAANGHKNGIEIGNLPDNFEPDRSLSGNDGRVVVAVNIGEIFFRGDLVGTSFGFSEIFPVYHYVRAQSLTIVDFDERRVLRHHHRGRNAEQSALISECLRVVAGRGGDNAAFFLLG